QEWIELRVGRGRAGIRTVPNKIPIQIDVVFVGAPQPGHAVRIENVRDNQSTVLREFRKVAQKSNLNGRSRKPLDAMKSRRMHKRASRIWGAENSDVDCEFVSPRPPDVQWKGSEEAARLGCCVTKPISGDEVVTRKERSR